MQILSQRVWGVWGRQRVEKQRWSVAPDAEDTRPKPGLLLLVLMVLVVLLLPLLPALTSPGPWEGRGGVLSPRLLPGAPVEPQGIRRCPHECSSGPDSRKGAVCASGEMLSVRPPRGLSHSCPHQCARGHLLPLPGWYPCPDLSIFGDQGDDKWDLVVGLRFSVCGGRPGPFLGALPGANPLHHPLIPSAHCSGGARVFFFFIF